MNIRRFFTSIIVILSFNFPGFSQFGKLQDQLKTKSTELLKEKLIQETDKKKQELDTTSFNYAIAFLDKSESYENKQEGENLIRAANFLVKDASSKSDLEKAADLYELGKINYNRRMYKVAEYNLQAAKLAFEALNGKDEAIYLKSIGLLGQLYSDMGRYEKATEFTQNAMEGWQSKSGENSSGYIAELNNLGVLQMNKALFNSAEPALLSVLKNISQNQGEQSITYAIVLNNLAILYQYMGRNEDALKNIDQSIGIAEKQLKEKSGTFVQLLTNKALIQQENNLLDAAEATYLYAKKLQENRLKLNAKSDPDYAHLLNNLASLYIRKGKEDEAENYLKLSLEIYELKFGMDHPLTAGAQADLGNLYRFQSKYETAQFLLSRSLQTRQSKLGVDHPTTVQNEEDLAIIHWKTGNFAEATALFTSVINKRIGYINSFFPSLSEAEKTKYWEKIKPGFHTFYNYVFSQENAVPELLRAVLEYRMTTKGLLLNSTTKMKNTILASENTELIKLYNTWLDQKQALAQYYNFSKSEIIEQKINLDSLEQATNLSEKRLSTLSATFADALATTKYEFTQLTASLKYGEMLIEIVQYPVFINGFTGETHYAALLANSTNTHPKLVRMTNGDKFDSRFFAQYKNLIRLKMNDTNSYSNFWKPLEAEMSGIKTIYFSPDGVYNQLNINTLKLSETQYMVDLYTVHNIGNPADLLDAKRKSSTKRDAFLLGFPNYESSEIVPLPGTLVEVNAVSTLLKSTGYTVSVKTETDANETAIKQLNSPALIHIATHGYFMEDVSSTGHIFGVQVEYAKNNPLLRSGLMLTGAGKSLGNGEKSFDQNDNGILTAYEAINLPLATTDLVVLSACETGKGDIKSGEGVYGLQRAFKMAGASRTIMSLWKVDDTATQQLMENFYTYWIKNKLSPEVAFRNAQIQLKKNYPHPYYWGAFVMME